MQSFILNQIKYKYLYLLAIMCFISRIIWIFFIFEHFPNALGGVNWYLNPIEEPLPPEDMFHLTLIKFMIQCQDDC